MSELKNKSCGVFNESRKIIGNEKKIKSYLIIKLKHLFLLSISSDVNMNRSNSWFLNGTRPQKQVKSIKTSIVLKLLFKIRY